MMDEAQIGTVARVVATWERWRETHRMGRTNCCPTSHALFVALSDLECLFDPSDEAELARATIVASPPPKRGGPP